MARPGAPSVSPPASRRQIHARSSPEHRSARRSRAAVPPARKAHRAETRAAPVRPGAVGRASNRYTFSAMLPLSLAGSAHWDRLAGDRRARQDPRTMKNREWNRQPACRGRLDRAAPLWDRGRSGVRVQFAVASIGVRGGAAGEFARSVLRVTSEPETIVMFCGLQARLASVAGLVLNPAAFMHSS